jgi:hypothetical protein
MPGRYPLSIQLAYDRRPIDTCGLLDSVRLLHQRALPDMAGARLLEGNGGPDQALRGMAPISVGALTRCSGSAVWLRAPLPVQYGFAAAAAAAVTACKLPSAPAAARAIRPAATRAAR